MKKSKFIKLFSALLCVVMLFVSCGGDAPSNPAEQKTEYTFSELISHKDTYESVPELGTAEELKFGDEIDGIGELVFFADVKGANTADGKSTVTVYNLKLGKPVLTVENAVNVTDNYLGDITNPIPVLEGYSFVTVETIPVEIDGWGTYVPVLTVTTVSEEQIPSDEYAAIKASLMESLDLTEEMILSGNTEAYPQLNYYYSCIAALTEKLYTAKFKLYGADGTEITTVSSGKLTEDELTYFITDYDYSEYVGLGENTVLYPSLGAYAESNGLDTVASATTSTAVSCFDKVLVFERELFWGLDSTTLVRALDAASNEHVHLFDYELGKYGYYFVNGDADGPGFEDFDSIQVFDKASGKLVYQLDVSEELTKREESSVDDSRAMASVLNDGRILLTLDVTYDYGDYDISENPYTYVDDYGDEIHVITYLLINPASGAMKEIEFDSMVIESLISRNYMESVFEIVNSNVTYADAFCNMAQGATIRYSEYQNSVVKMLNYDDNSVWILDDGLNVITSNEKLCIEQENAFDFRPLPNGDYLVDLVDTAPSDVAIVTKDGTVRAYLPEDYTILGELVLIGDVLYDYDLNPVFDLEEESIMLADLDHLFGGKLLGYFVDKDYQEFTNDPDKNQNGTPDDEETIYVWDDKNGNGIYDWEENYEPTDEEAARWEDNSGYYALEYKDGEMVLERLDIDLGRVSELEFKESDERYIYIVVNSESDDAEHRIYNTKLEKIVASSDKIYVSCYGTNYYAYVVNTNKNYALNGAESK